MQSEDDKWMKIAIAKARKAECINEVPIGAVLVKEGRVIGSGYNRRETDQDPTAHAELIAIRRAAARTGAWRLTGATLYVTLEPCLMCMGAIILSRIDRLVFGCFDPKGGAAGSLYDLSDDARLNHRLPITSRVREAECSGMLSSFFRQLRETKRNATKERIA